MNAQDRFAEFAARPEEELDLAEGALLIAAEAYPDLDVERYLEQLDSLADEAEAALPPRDEVRGSASGTQLVTESGESEELDVVMALNRFLFRDQRFEGDRETYYDERNSFLCDVLDRRRGIPITLAVVYLEVAHRLCVPIEGINFPTHFLLRHATAPYILIDPFQGQVITQDDCAELLHEALGDGVELEEEHFQRATPRQMLVRMLGNLKHVYVSEESFEKALSCADRALLLAPDDWIERRDRGLLYARLECWQAALADLEPFANVAGPDIVKGSLARTLDEVRRRARQVH